MSKMENLSSSPPTNINPYDILGVPVTASPADIKSAYKKLALKHHPDKVSTAHKEAAHTQFQQIAFAYAILSSPPRRARYDATGSTSESLDLSDESFNWIEFFRAQYTDIVSASRLNEFKANYQNSEEEKRDVLSAYVAGKGDLNVVYRKVMLSNPLEDEERFRGYVDKAIEEGGVEGYEAYVNEAAGKKERRIKRAEKESREAEKHAKTLGVYDKLFGDEGKSKKQTKQKGAGDEAGLMELMQQRAKGRNDGFLDGLEAKYGGKGKTKKRKEEEPPEEAFARMAKKAKSTPAKEKVKEDDIGDAEETSDDGESLGEEEALPKTPPRGKNHGRKHKLSREQQESPKFTKNVATSTASKKTSRRGGKEKKPVSAQTNVETEPPQEEPSPQPKKKAKKAKTKQ